MENKVFFNALLKSQGKFQVAKGNEELSISLLGQTGLSKRLCGHYGHVEVDQPKDYENNVCVKCTVNSYPSGEYPFVYDDTRVFTCWVPKEAIATELSSYFRLHFDGKAY